MWSKFHHDRYEIRAMRGLARHTDTHTHTHIHTHTHTHTHIDTQTHRHTLTQTHKHTHTHTHTHTHRHTHTRARARTHARTHWRTDRDRSWLKYLVKWLNIKINIKCIWRQRRSFIYDVPEYGARISSNMFLLFCCLFGKSFCWSLF